MQHESDGWHIGLGMVPYLSPVSHVPSRCLVHLKEIYGLPPIKEYVVCTELHKDGYPHLHAFIRYERKVSFQPRRWDLESYHGFYEPARSWNAVAGYVRKGGNFIANFDVDAARSKKRREIAI